MSNLKAVIAEVEVNAQSAVDALQKNQVTIDKNGKALHGVGQVREPQIRKVVEQAVGNASNQIINAIVEDVVAKHSKAVSH